MSWGGVGVIYNLFRYIIFFGFSPLRYLVLYFTENVMGWNEVGAVIPNKCVAPLHDLLGFKSRYGITPEGGHAHFSSRMLKLQFVGPWKKACHLYKIPAS